VVIAMLKLDIDTIAIAIGAVLAGLLIAGAIWWPSPFPCLTLLAHWRGCSQNAHLLLALPR
jgi:hypothetical protein